MRSTTSQLATVVALAGVLLAGGCRKSAAPPKKQGGGGMFTVDVVPVATQPLRETLSATGTLLARESVTLQAERAGAITEVRFEEGKPVKAGEVLVAIDDAELQAQAGRAKAQLELAMALETRQRDLLKTRGISEAEFDQSRANLSIAKAENQLAQAQLAKTKIVAPFDGVAGLRQVSVGTYLTPGTPICTFQDISALKIDFSLPERYLPHIRPGQKVTFRIAGRSDTFQAEIAAIDPAIDVATRSLQIRAMVQNEEQRLLPGSFAEVEVTLDQIADAILIPPIALIPGLKQQTVFIHRDGAAEERKVQSGLRTANAVQIIDGLQPGDELITSGVLQLRPGMKVRVKPLPAPASTAAPGAKPVVET
ncbi:MAG TPA: efflux RND transporter periplasmic adaptor subunit [Chthoniobacteraceae bacterium]